MFKKDKHFIPAYFFAGLIVIGSSISTRGLRKIRRIHEFFDLVFSEYSLHFFGFAIFAVLLAWGYYKNKTSSLLFRTGLVACLFGLVIEVYQKFLPCRDFSVVDLAFDWAGVLLALAVFWYVIIKKHLFTAHDGHLTNLVGVQPTALHTGKLAVPKIKEHMRHIFDSRRNMSLPLTVNGDRGGS